MYKNESLCSLSNLIGGKKKICLLHCNYSYISASISAAVKPTSIHFPLWKSPSSVLPFNLPTCSSPHHSFKISSHLWESKAHLKDSGRKLVLWKAGTILRKRKITTTRNWVPVPKSNEGEPFHTWMKSSKPALGQLTTLMFRLILFSLEIRCV